MGVATVGGVSSVLDASAIVGVVPVVITVVGVLAICGLLVRRGRSWWLLAVPIGLVGGVVGTAAVVVVDFLWRPFPDPLPMRVLLWIALGLAAVGLGVAGI